MSEEVQVELFRSKVRLLHLVMGWGTFVFLVVLPLFAMSIGTLILVMLCLGFLGSTLLWSSRIMKSRFQFWIPLSVFGPSFSTIYPALLGIMFFLALWWVLNVLISGSHIFIDMLILALIVFVATVIVLFRVLCTRLEKKRKGKRVRFLHEQVEVVDDTVRNTLDALNLDYHRVEKVSRRPSSRRIYKVNDSGISVELLPGIQYTTLFVDFQMFEDAPTAREIEKSIDSLLKGDT